MIVAPPYLRSAEQQRSGFLRSAHIEHDSYRRPLPGGTAFSVPGAVKIPGQPKDDLLNVTLRLRASADHAHSRTVKSVSAEELGRSSLRDRRYLSHAEFREFHSASAADIEIVCTFAQEFSLLVTDTSRARRTVELRGAICDIERAFGTSLRLYESPSGKCQLL